MAFPEFAAPRRELLTNVDHLEGELAGYLSASDASATPRAAPIRQKLSDARMFAYWSETATSLHWAKGFLAQATRRFDAAASDLASLKTGAAAADEPANAHASS